ncbi:MAG: hypothetical protein ABI615_04025 [Chthoniobacterales bacterium]
MFLRDHYKLLSELNFWAALVVAVFALWLCRRHWVASFLFIGAGLSLVLGYGLNEVLRMGNGAHSPGEPVMAAWQVVMIYNLQGLFPMLLLFLATLGAYFLISGDGRWTRKRAGWLSGGFAVASAVLIGLSIRGVPPAPTIGVLNPQGDDPKCPISTLLACKITIKKDMEVNSPDGECEVSLTNTSEQEIALTGVQWKGLLFYLQIIVKMRREDGRDMSYMSTVGIPGDREILKPGETWNFIQRIAPWSWDHQPLKPDSYSVYFGFPISVNEKREKVVSNVIEFRLKP